MTLQQAFKIGRIHNIWILYTLVEHFRTQGTVTVTCSVFVTLCCDTERYSKPQPHNRLVSNQWCGPNTPKTPFVQLRNNHAETSFSAEGEAAGRSEGQRSRLPGSLWAQAEQPWTWAAKGTFPSLRGKGPRKVEDCLALAETKSTQHAICEDLKELLLQKDSLMCWNIGKCNYLPPHTKQTPQSILRAYTSCGNHAAFCNVSPSTEQTSAEAGIKYKNQKNGTV